MVLKQFIVSTDIASSTALSFLYSYSRSINKNQITVISTEMIEKLNRIIVDSLHTMNNNEIAYLLSIYNNLNYFPSSISQIFKRLSNAGSVLSDDQCFTILCTIMKSSYS